MVVFCRKTDLSEKVAEAESMASGQTFPGVLLQLLTCSPIPSEADCKQGIERKLPGFLTSLNPSLRATDSQGRITFSSDSMDDEDQMRCLMNRCRKEERVIAALGDIGPIKRTLSKEHPVSVDVIDEMLRESDLIPYGHHRIIARGIAAFIQGENIDAASILVPQLENTLRRKLTLGGIDCTFLKNNGSQSEATLSMLLSRENKKKWRPELKKMFPDGYIHEIDLLFSFSGGSAIRHKIAHGLMPVGHFVNQETFWDPEVTYACWLIIHLIALPMINRWSEVEKAYYRASGEIPPTGINQT